ncbi:hypothetical protein MMC30_000790 [Trapelia coarctata]|nr:hypothetical protein [Trapelia coarctata]
MAEVKGEVIDDGTGMLFAVFCTAEIPLHILDEFITASRKQVRDVSMFACIIDSREPLTARTWATRTPVAPFTSPFLHASLDVVEAYFNETMRDDQSGHYGNVTYIVLDSQTVTDKTCLCVSVLDDDTQYFRSDFNMAFVVMGPPTFQLLNFGDGAYQEIYEEGRGITLEKFRALEKKWE